MTGLADRLKRIEPWDEAFPGVDAGLPPLDQPGLSEEVDGEKPEAVGPEAPGPGTRRFASDGGGGLLVTHA